MEHEQVGAREDERECGGSSSKELTHEKIEPEQREDGLGDRDGVHPGERVAEEAQGDRGRHIAQDGDRRPADAKKIRKRSGEDLASLNAGRGRVAVEVERELAVMPEAKGQHPGEEQPDSRYFDPLAALQRSRPAERG